MTTILLALLIFLIILEYIVIFDIILSWLMLAGINLRPRFFNDVLGPLYAGVRKFIPTRFGAFDFTPIVIILALLFLRGLILMSFPEVGIAMNNLLNR